MDVRRVLSYVRRACEDYDMIKTGDRIAVGVSGGKDSLTLLCALAEKLSLSVVAGSDGHSTASAGKAGIITKERIRTGEDLVRILKSGNYELYKG